jgi:hypothetical protein
MKRMSRIAAGLVTLALGMFAASSQSAYQGTWQLDAAKSQVSDGHTMTLTMQLAGDQLKFVGVVKKGDDAVTSQFSCGTASGAECAFDEGGHKSKVSIWFSGPSLNLCKTDGPVGDVVTEWKMELSPDNNTLTISVSHVDPQLKDETLVFTKKSGA